MDFVETNVERLIEMYDCPVECKQMCYKKLGMKGENAFYPFYKLNDEFYGIVPCKLGFNISLDLFIIKNVMSMESLKRGISSKEEHQNFVNECNKCLSEMEEMTDDFVFNVKSEENKKKKMFISNDEIAYLLAFRLNEEGKEKESMALIDEVNKR